MQILQPCIKLLFYVSNGGKNVSNLKLEVFESNKPIEQISFYVYSLVPKELVENIQQVIRGAVWKIFYDSSVPAFTDDRRIYTLSKLENLEIDDSYTS